MEEQEIKPADTLETKTTEVIENRDGRDFRITTIEEPVYTEEEINALREERNTKISQRDQLNDDIRELNDKIRALE